MELLFPILTCSFFAAIVQSCCGSGYAMILTALLPFFMPFKDVVVISCISSLFGNVLLVWKYRQFISIKDIWLPALCNVIVTMLVVRFMGQMSNGALKRCYGVVLLILAAFFLFLGQRVHIKPTPINSVLIGSCVGLTTGLFSVGGPLISLYLLAFMEDKRTFMGSAQLFFLLGGLSSLFSRIASGAVTLQLAKLSFASLIAVICGMFLGTWILRRLSMATLKKTIYIFITCIGIYMILGH